MISLHENKPRLNTITYINLDPQLILSIVTLGKLTNNQK